MEFPEITDDDAALLRIMAGAVFHGTASLTLPSGITLDAATARAWIEAHQ